MRPLPSLDTLLVDGAFVIDNSSLEKLKCPRLFENEVVRQRVLADAKAGRNFGSCLHAGWAVRYRECLEQPITPEVVLKQNEAMAKWFQENPQPVTDFRDLAHAQRVMKAYNAFYQLEPFKVVRNPFNDSPLVECSFMLPIGSVDSIPCYYSGKLDLVTQDDHCIWAGPDHKSAFMFGETWDAAMAVDGGQLGYTWATWQVLGQRPRGYIIDGVRIRRPNKEQRMAMEYGSYEPAQAPVDGSDFKRIPFDVTEETLEEWRENVLALINTIFFHHRNGYYPMHRWNCTNKFGKCDMYDVCHIPRKAREDVLYNSTRYEESKWKMGLNTPES